jgi:hypothetical protein
MSRKNFWASGPQLVINSGNTLSTSGANEKIEQLARYYFEEVWKKTVRNNRMRRWQWDSNSHKLPS